MPFLNFMIGERLVFNYLKYMVTVPRKFILNWTIAPGVVFIDSPLAFANSSVESLLIDTQREAFRGMSENETMMNLLGISDWDNVFTLEGMVTTYFYDSFCSYFNWDSHNYSFK
jgi:hypothetical protein